MSLKSGGIATTLVAVILVLSLLPTVTYAGGYYRHHHRHHHHFYGHRHHHGHGVRLWIDLRPYPGWSAPPAARGEYRVWTPSVELAQPGSSEVPDQGKEKQYCREFQREVIIDGKPEHAYGTACLQPDGSWKIVP